MYQFFQIRFLAGTLQILTNTVENNDGRVDRIPTYRQHAGNKTVEELIEFQLYEEELYSKYKEFYGYVFFIAKKIAQ